MTQEFRIGDRVDVAIHGATVLRVDERDVQFAYPLADDPAGPTGEDQFVIDVTSPAVETGPAQRVSTRPSSPGPGADAQPPSIPDGPNAAFVAGLRQLADLLEASPVQLPVDYFGINASLNAYDPPKEAFGVREPNDEASMRNVRVTGECLGKEPSRTVAGDREYWQVHRSFGSVSFNATYSRPVTEIRKLNDEVARLRAELERRGGESK